MKIISIANSKGGVGKSVTTIHLGAALAATGHEVLLVDVDLSGALTEFFQIQTDTTPTTADVLSGAAGIEEAAQLVRDRLYVVPATADIERSERDLSSASGGEVRLRRAFKNFVAQEGYFDYVLIDCPSGWGAVTRNALLASRAVIVPLNSEPAAITQAAATIASAEELGGYHDHALELLGVLLTRFRSTNAAKTIEAQALEKWDDKVFQTRIRQAERLNELTMTQQTTSETRSGPVGADYAALAVEVAARAKGLK